MAGDGHFRWGRSARPPLQTNRHAFHGSLIKTFNEGVVAGHVGLHDNDKLHVFSLTELPST